MVLYLKSIRSVSKKTADEILADIEYLQWSALNIDTFMRMYNLLENKYLDRNTEEPLNSLIENFFTYFRRTWVDSGENMWFEGANPWGVVNNQGVEGKNKEIKAAHTFRKKQPMGQFFTAAFRLVRII